MSGLTAYAGVAAEKAGAEYFVGKGIAPVLANVLGMEVGSLASKTVSTSLGLVDPLINIRSKDTYSKKRSTEVKTELNFNNLITD